MHELRALPLADVNLVAAYSIFIASYFVFALGKFPGLKIERPGAAIVGAVAMVAFHVVPPREALHFIDFPTIVLLFSMMLIVGNLHLVGFFVMLLKSLAPSFSDPHIAWLLLAMASTLAGNLTITGSVANIIVIESAKPDVHIGFWDYFRVGLPVTVLTLLFGSLWVALVR